MRVTFAWIRGLCLVTAVNWLAPGARGEPAGEKVDFNRDIRPILSNHCFQCHGPDEKERKAKLRLDSREGAIDQGQVIVPGKVKESYLVDRIKDEPERLMPPKKFNKPLSPKQIELIERWIEQGAEYQGHWAFIAPKKPAVPAVKNVGWARNPIDAFILARLEREKVQPTAEADRRTLIRRLTFDLTGLPPTPAEVEAFVNDPSPDAYEKVVDRLLASPQFGEHQTRYWLDAIRYGDTHGLHLDNYREMWPFRDWVVRAYNSNLPFDRFTIEQIAGDLLPEPTRDQLVASGYNRAHVTTNEGGSIADEVYVRNVVDRVDTTSTAWMGLTAGCAVCHTHKFDPISQKEYYQLFAFFNSMDGNEMDGNKKDPAPVISVPTPELATRLASLEEQIARAKQGMEEREGRLGSEYAQWLKEASARTGKVVDVNEGIVAHYPLDETSGVKVRDAAGKDTFGQVRGNPSWKPGKFGNAFECDGKRFIDLGKAGDFEHDQPFSFGCWVRWNGGANPMAPLARMDDAEAHRGYDIYIARGQVAAHIIHTWPDYALKVTTRAKIKPNEWAHLLVTYDGSGKASGITVYVDGKPQPVDVNADSLQGSIRCKTELRIGKRNPGSGYSGLVDEVRLYSRRLSAEEAQTLAGTDPIAPVLAVAPEKRTPEQNRLLKQHYLSRHDADYRKLQQQVASLQAELTKSQSAMPTTMVMKEMETPKPAYLLIRGAYDKKGEQVERATPAFLPPMKEDAPRNRLGLAQWLVDPAHPLTARVAVNRFWQQFFGVGIVKTAEDFGAQGEWPSHPDLLDWLAVQFIEDGWDRKKTLRRMVTSATYRQSSHASPEAYRRDRENRLFGRGPRFRLDAESVRDQALAVSGLLVRKFGGPSVKPPQPSGLWEAVGYTSSNTARFTQDTGDKLYRRSVYTFWKRTSPPPQMTALDAPSREACTMRRERTNTPLQALLLMNEQQFVEAARHLAQRIMTEGGATPTERVTFAFHLATARKPAEADLADLLAAYSDFRAYYQAEVESAKNLIRVGDTPPDPNLDPSELAAWTMIANLVLNLDEVLTKE